MSLLLAARDRLLDSAMGVGRVPPLNTAGAATHSDPAAPPFDFLLDPGEDLAQQMDYAGLNASPRFQAYLDALPGLSGFDPAHLPTHHEQLAFWVNVYNALTVHAVLALKVDSSVAEQWFGLAFFRKAAYQIGGQRVSLDDIEHGILRANRGHPYLPGRQFAAGDPRLAWVLEPMDPRIHFALNCASRSCPPIRIYRADQLDQQLTLASQNYLSSEVKLDEARRSLHLPAILRWFAVDFGGPSGVADFVATHHSDSQVGRILTERPSSWKLVHDKFDWSLNRKPGGQAS